MGNPIQSVQQPFGTLRRTLRRTRTATTTTTHRTVTLTSARPMHLNSRQLRAGADPSTSRQFCRRRPGRPGQKRHHSILPSSTATQHIPLDLLALPSNTPVCFSVSVALGNKCLARPSSTGWLVPQRQHGTGWTAVVSPSPLLASPWGDWGVWGVSAQRRAWEFSTIPSQQTWESRPRPIVSISPTTACPASLPHNCPVNKFATRRSCPLFVVSDHRALAFLSDY